ncbi:hypothetical protein [Chitinimonas koreensis]|uniref:hypothetical protein n=1 Tax=Chitinimonas koreensis TaxID=356302 RepID=UPI000421BB8B|nr:hypothetical protein [Chitinimonas koreensis]QNM98114.1 hypothetical protein H9L41_07640 [Chitinimonas koreensis]
MTTIAWDGKTVAADTQANNTGLRSYTKKLYRLADGRIYGFTGEIQDGVSVYEWLNAGGRDARPHVSSSFAALLVCPDGRAYTMEDKLVLLAVYETFRAIGSGRNFAMGALVVGADAVQAVKAAIRLDVYSGGDIDALEVEGAGRR